MGLRSSDGYKVLRVIKVLQEFKSPDGILSSDAVVEVLTFVLKSCRHSKFC